MDDESIIRGISDVTKELQQIGGSISTVVENESYKKYYDESLAQVVKDAVLEVLVKFSTVEAGKNYYYNELVELIKNSMSEIIEKVAKTKPDMSPLIRIASEISNQNKEIINTLLSISRPDSNEQKYEGMLTLMMDVLKKNNEVLGKIVLHQQAQVINITPKKKMEWEFDIVKREQHTGKIQKILAIEK
jgi:hypothetical protein